MKTFIFKTTATMKEYNCKKWWIDSKIVRDIEVKAETVEEALKEYQRIAKEKYYVVISNRAIKNKSPMYIDTKEEGTKQVGFVITGKTEFENNYKWSMQYIDLWVTVLTVIETNF